MYIHSQDAADHMKAKPLASDESTETPACENDSMSIMENISPEKLGLICSHLQTKERRQLFPSSQPSFDTSDHGSAHQPRMLNRNETNGITHATAMTNSDAIKKAL